MDEMELKKKTAEVNQAIVEIKKRKDILDEKEKKLKAQEASLVTREAHISDTEARDKILNERELALEARATACDVREEVLAKRESRIANEELSSRKKLEAELDELKKHAREDIAERLRKLSEETAKSEKIIHDFLESELKRSREETENRNKALNNALKEQDARLLEKRTTCLDEIEAQCEKVREERLTSVEAVAKARMDASEKEIAARLSACEQKEKQLCELERELKGRELEIEEGKKDNKVEKSRLEMCKYQIEKDIEDEVTSRYEDLIAERDEFKTTAERRLEDYKRDEAFLHLYEELKAKLGDDPASVLGEREKLLEALDQKTRELAERPAQELKEKYDELKNREDAYNEEFKKLRDRKLDYERTIEENAQLETEKNNLESRKAELERRNQELEEFNAQLMAQYETPKQRDELIKQINWPYIEVTPERMIFDDPKKKVTELDWLEGIHQQCGAFEFDFNKRILYSFHTALKTAEISPLTVLAGVSGTGKSKLPRLYSHFGGFNFLSLPVQPNWDSPEAIMGYFNSISNSFESEKLLHLLAQSQREKANQNGLKDTMSLVLLDEMNLANVELYFSDFLSQLEDRCGIKEGDPNYPAWAVKLGSKIKPYSIALGRNVLWAGTMNQDETTKSLSDKVLDRGFIINFPRPSSLINRKIRDLPEASPLLPRSVWESWIQKESLFDAQTFKPYKDLLEGINAELGKTGRALGHRVYQSVEHYMSNHPLVTEAKASGQGLTREMDRAFEDMLVQKVMPKLRGLETRGKQGDCLDRIQGLIGESGRCDIEADFRNAREQGYGQFLWCSSEYLDEKIAPESKKPVELASTKKEDSVADGVPEKSAKPSSAKEEDTIVDGISKNLYKRLMAVGKAQKWADQVVVVHKPNYLEKYQKEFPDLTPEIVSATHKKVLNDLRNGK